MVKIVYCISKLSRLSDTEFHRCWRDVHGPIAGRIPGCRKYIQSHAIHRELNGRGPAFDGVAELCAAEGIPRTDSRCAPEAAGLLVAPNNFGR